MKNLNKKTNASDIAHFCYNIIIVIFYRKQQGDPVPEVEWWYYNDGRNAAQKLTQKLKERKIKITTEVMDFYKNFFHFDLSQN